MNKSRSLITIPGLIIFAALLTGLGWGSYHFAQKNISGEGFIIQWIGINSLVADGQDPYSNLVTAQIQENVKFENTFAVSNPPKYTSPLYSGIVVFPFAIIGNRTISRALWLAAQLLAIILIQLLAIKLTGWKPAWYLLMIFSLFTMFSYHVFIPWIDGGLSIWAALFLVLALLAIHNNWNEVGGIFLALAAIQPQMVILVIIFTLIWAASQRKKILVLWFFITMIFISVIGILLVPNWVMQYIKLIYNYPANFPSGNPEALFIDLWPGLGKQLGWVVTGLAGIVLGVEWWQARKRDFRWFLWTVCLTLALSQWIGIPTIPGNFTGLILPLILVSTMLTEHWPLGGKWVAVFMVMVLFIWEWAIFYLDIISFQVGMQLNLLIPLPLISIIGLYWVRWWAIKPRRLLIEELRFGEIY